LKQRPRPPAMSKRKIGGPKKGRRGREGPKEGRKRNHPKVHLVKDRGQGKTGDHHGEKEAREIQTGKFRSIKKGFGGSKSTAENSHWWRGGG